MTKPILTILAPIGATLMLFFASLTAYQMLQQVGEAMTPEGRAADVTSLAPVGVCGVVMFGLGMMNLMLLRRKPTIVARGLLTAAAFALVAGAVSIGYGDWQLQVAFGELATAETVEPEPFLQRVGLGKIPLMIGYAAVLIGAGLVAWAAGMMTEKSRLSRSPVIIGAVSFLLLVLAAFWSHTSVRLFPEAISSPQIEPAQLASCISGAVRSVLLLSVSIIGFSLATILVALSARPKSP